MPLVFIPCKFVHTSKTKSTNSQTKYRLTVQSVLDKESMVIVSFEVNRLTIDLIKEPYQERNLQFDKINSPTTRFNYIRKQCTCVSNFILKTI